MNGEELGRVGVWVGHRAGKGRGVVVFLFKA